jgi:hypothetical protein
MLHFFYEGDMSVRVFEDSSFHSHYHRDDSDEDNDNSDDVDGVLGRSFFAAKISSVS